jgi:hypothetical protein
VVKNTGPFIGMGSFFDDRDYKAISVIAKNNVIIENNIVDSTGLTAIQFQGNNVRVQRNYINLFCYQLDDGAGIYTYVDGTKEKPALPFTGRVIKDNIILNGRGAPHGSVSKGKAEGIYLDNGSMNVSVLGNSIGYVSNKALAFNNPYNVVASNNTCFNNGGAWSASRRTSWQAFGKLSITNNIFYTLYDHQTQVSFLYAGLNKPDDLSIWEAIQLAGDIDHNYYNSINPFAFNYVFAPVEGKEFVYPSPLTLEHWQDFTGQDAHSKKPFKLIPDFKMNNRLGGNLIKNGDFKKDLVNVNIDGEDTEAAWDNSGKITAEGSIKIMFDQASPNHYSQVHGELGAVITGKKYLLRFNTLGNSECGMLRVFLRRTQAPFDVLSATESRPFGTTKQQHEFLLEPTASANASYVIEIERNACTSYVDDIELYEADAIKFRQRDFVRFEFNATANPITISLDKNYVGVDGTLYADSLTLPPFSSKILIADVNDR